MTEVVKLLWMSSSHMYTQPAIGLLLGTTRLRQLFLHPSSLLCCPCQSQESRRWAATHLLFAAEGSLWARTFLENQLYWLQRGMTPSSTGKGFQWNFVAAFSCDQSRLQDLQSCFSSAVWSFSVVSQDNFYVVDLTDCSTPPSFCLSFKAREPFLHFRFRDNRQNATDCSVWAGLTTLHLPGPGYPHCISSGRQELQESFHGVNQTAYPALLPPVEYYFTGSVTGNSTITARLMMFRNGAELENTRGRGWWTAHSMGKL